MRNDGASFAMPAKMPRPPGFGSTRVALFTTSIAISQATKGLSSPRQRKLIFPGRGIKSKPRSHS